MHVSRSHTRFWARNPNTGSARTAGTESSKIQRHHWVQTNNNNNLSTSAFFSNLRRPRAPERSVGTNARPAAQTRCYKQHAPHAEHIEVVVHRKLLCTSQVLLSLPVGTPGNTMYIACSSCVPAVRLRLHFGERLWWKIKRGDSQSLILKVLGSKLKSARRNVM